MLKRDPRIVRPNQTIPLHMDQVKLNSLTITGRWQRKNFSMVLTTLLLLSQLL